MSKHKIIHKIFEHPRREDSRAESPDHSDSSDEEPFQLHQVDCNNYFFNQRPDSLLELIDTLNSDPAEEMSQELPYQNSHFNYSQTPSSHDLQRINARYLAVMSDFEEKGGAEPIVTARKVRFDGQVRAKYFSSEAAAAQVFDAEQYTSFEQYQQTSDEERPSQR